MSKYAVGDKFIIEIEEKFENDADDIIHEEKLYRIKGFNTLVFDDYGLDKLQKLNPKLKIEDIDDMLAEHDLKKEAYEKGLNDAWELARKIRGYVDETYSENEIKTIFGSVSPSWIMENNTYQEALAKIEAYKKSQQIQVGDVVRRISDDKEYLIITKENDNSAYNYGVISLTSMIIDRISYNMSDFEKTGKHIDIEHLLEQIRGNE